MHFLQLNAVEVAVQLTLQDFSIFRQIEATEYVDDLFQLDSRYGTPMLSKFAEVYILYINLLYTSKINYFRINILIKCIMNFQLVNTEMFWVVTEICSEHNLIRRSKMIKQFIKVARMYIKIFN